MLPNGNLLICVGNQGHFFEITSTSEIVWEFINPVGSSKIMAQGDDPSESGNKVFRAKKYSKQFPGFECHDLSPRGAIQHDQVI